MCPQAKHNVPKCTFAQNTHVPKCTFARNTMCPNHTFAQAKLFLVPSSREVRRAYTRTHSCDPPRHTFSRTHKRPGRHTHAQIFDGPPRHPFFHAQTLLAWAARQVMTRLHFYFFPHTTSLAHTPHTLTHAFFPSPLAEILCSFGNFCFFDALIHRWSLSSLYIGERIQISTISHQNICKKNSNPHNAHQKTEYTRYPTMYNTHKQSYLRLKHHSLPLYHKIRSNHYKTFISHIARTKKKRERRKSFLGLARSIDQK